MPRAETIPAYAPRQKGQVALGTRAISAPGMAATAWLPHGRWTAARRVLAKIEHHAAELFSRIGLIVTKLNLPRRAVVRFYNKRWPKTMRRERGQRDRLRNSDFCVAGLLEAHLAHLRLAPMATLLPPMAAGSTLLVFGKLKWGSLSKRRWRRSDAVPLRSGSDR